MGLLNHLLRRRSESVQIQPEARPLERFLEGDKRGKLIRKKVSVRGFEHRCGFEPLEERQLLSADGLNVTMASVYFECRTEYMGDMFSVCWVGDRNVEESTQMTKLTINLGDEVYFDTTGEAPGAGRVQESDGIIHYPYAPFTLVTKDQDPYGLGEVTEQFSTIGLDDFSYYFDGDPANKIGNGASTLTIIFNEGVMTEGEKLVFLIDVDHREVTEDTMTVEDLDLVSSGATITTWFTSDSFVMNEKVYDLVNQTSDPAFYVADYSHDIRPDMDDVIQSEKVHLLPDGGYGAEVSDNYGNTAAVVSNIYLAPKPTISGYVYADVVKNCYFTDPEDYPISGVEVALQRFNADSGIYSTIATTRTNSDGYYEFTSLDTGTYRIVSESNIPYTEGGVTYVYTDSCARSQTNPVSPDPLVLTTSVDIGSDSTNNNFGKVLRGSIEGNVYEDWNDDGKFDPNEKGIKEVTVGLFYLNGHGEYVAYEENGVAVTTKTDINGHYKFDNLKVYDKDNGNLYMTYAVREVQPEDYVDGKDTPGTINGVVVGEATANDYITKIQLGWNQHGIDYNFGELKLGSIEGNVFEDRNDNGWMEAGEPGIARVKIELLKWNGTQYEVIDSQLTDNAGHYRFDNLAINGEYAVRETQPTEYVDGKEQLGTVNNVPRGVVGEDQFTKINIGWDEHGVEYNFGELLLGSISGYVFEDHDNNGFYEPAAQGGVDVPIANVTVTLYVKGADGNYTIARDRNGDPRTARTDALGYYKFDNLDIEKVYAVRETQPSDYSDGKEQLGTFNGVNRGIKGNDEFTEIDVHWDDHGVNYNFGELKLGSISGYVFEDHDNNGFYEPQSQGGVDVPIANVKVTLYRKDANGHYAAVYDASGNLRTTMTDSLGHYQFDNLDIEQVYAVRETQPAGYTDGKEQLGTFNGVERGVKGNDEFTEIAVHWDDHGVNYNFGELKLGSISGYVFEDHNDNGVYEPKAQGGVDVPIAEVTVSLYQKVGNDYVAVLDANGVARTARTDKNGYYEFSGLDINQVYAVRETQPADYTDGKEQLGTVGGVERGVKGNDEFTQIGIGWDEHGVNYNFGELKLGSISGYVYYDANKNGIFDAGDIGLANETVTLRVLVDGEYTNAVVGTTDSTGFYIFDNLQINKIYSLTETQPAGYLDGKDSVGTIKGIVVGTLVHSDYMNNIAVGWDDHGINYNFGEILDTEPEEPGIPNIPTTPALNIPRRYFNMNPYQMSYIPSNVATAPVTVSRFGGGAVAPNYAWHLSVINGGYPRSIDALNSVAGYRGMLGRSQYLNVAWSGQSTDNGEWLIRGADGSVAHRYVFGTSDAVAVVGDWDGDGTDNLGLYVNGQWLLDRNGNGTWDDDDLWAEMGSSKDMPVAGDWDADGKDDIGIFGPRWAGDSLAISLEPGLPADKNPNTFRNVSRPKNLPPEYTESNANVRVMKHRNTGDVRIDLIDHVFEYGQDGDQAITGDWNGDGVDKIGVYRDGTWYIDINGNGVFDDGDVTIEGFGNSSSVPIVGDWDGNGIDNIGLFEDGLWALDTNGDYRPDTHFTFGRSGDQPISGDFNGDGKDEAGVYRPGSDSTIKSDDTLSM